VWNLVASLAFSVSVAASSYGVGRVVTGHVSVRDLLTLVLGLGVGVLVVVWFVRHRHRTAARHAP
jgi:membrane protein DedA with SNARE-associated domain